MRIVEFVQSGKDPIAVRVLDEARWDRTTDYLRDCGMAFEVLATPDGEEDPDAVDDDALSDLVAPRDE